MYSISFLFLEYATVWLIVKLPNGLVQSLHKTSFSSFLFSFIYIWNLKTWVYQFNGFSFYLGFENRSYERGAGPGMLRRSDYQHCELFKGGMCQ